MRKQVASTQEETTPGSEVLGGKSPKLFGQDEEAQNSPAVIIMDSLERASDTPSALEGAAQDAYKEACALLEDGVPNEGFPMLIELWERLHWR